MKKNEVDFLTKRIVSGSPEQQSLQKDRVFPNVYLKGRGCPTSDGLNKIGWDSVFCKRGSSASAHRLSSDVVAKETPHAVDEERSRRVGTVGTEPKVT